MQSCVLETVKSLQKRLRAIDFFGARPVRSADIAKPLGRDGSVFSELPARANVSPIGTRTVNHETAAAVSLDLLIGCRPGKTVHQADCGRSLPFRLLQQMSPRLL
jgi:hypothetical protein